MSSSTESKPTAPAGGHRSVTADLVEGYRVEIRGSGHTWLADEPVDLGGSDTGPTPYEMLLGSLAACTCITLSMYARRKGWPLESISVRYDYARIHAEDCGFCESDAEGLIDTVSSQIFIEGDFTDDQRRRLAEVAVRCPVHKTLEAGVVLDDEVIVG